MAKRGFWVIFILLFRMYAGTEAVFSTQLGIVKDLLNSKNLNVSDEVVLNSLGHNNRALFSVPTAIYCFLRAIKSIPQIEVSIQERICLIFFYEIEKKMVFFERFNKYFLKIIHLYTYQYMIFKKY